MAMVFVPGRPAPVSIVDGVTINDNQPVKVEIDGRVEIVGVGIAL
jgi:hypothetical protein